MRVTLVDMPLKILLMKLRLIDEIKANYSSEIYLPRIWRAK